MKKILSLLVFIPFVCAGCGITSIVTETPYSGNRTSYRTTVRSNRTNSVTTNVYAANDDISLYLDLQGVAAAFSQASTVKEFESLLNNSSYMLSDLDLNGDGYVDYLRVLETLDGSTHVFLIQAVLGEDVYQDVATLVAEVPATTTTYHVQVIGAPFLYGPDYIIEPVYYTRPAIFVSFGVGAYVAWTSPWRWNYYPAYYTRPAPIHIGHYQAYIGTYMRNHRYCHNVTYVNVYHYTNYNIVCRNVQRNDYIVKHPERSFNTRVSNIRSIMNTSANKQANIRNAKDIRDIYDSNKKTTTSSRSQYRRTTGNNNYGNNGNRSVYKNGNSNTERSSRQVQRNDDRMRDASNVNGKVTESQNKPTTYRRNNETTQKKATTVINNNKAAQRSTSTTSTSGSSNYRRSSSSQSAAQRSKASTTVTSRVKKSGTTNTKVNKISSTGEKTTYRRK